ncbi:MAG: endonuclease domain-containing protein [Solirubrobacterales bacterium]
MIEHRVGAMRLRRVHRGVFVAGCAPLGARGRWMAAVLAVGDGRLWHPFEDGAVALSYRSASSLAELEQGGAEMIEVSGPLPARHRPGIRTHQAMLPADEVTLVDGIPVTTVARTLLDLAGVLPVARVERLLERAEGLGGADGPTPATLVSRYPGRRGVARLRLALGLTEGAAPVLRSEFEARFRSWLREHRLPEPACNVRIHAGGREYESDCVWRDAGLIVELDGRETHGTRAAFERDRARDRALQAAGWRVIRVTWTQLQTDPLLLVDLARALKTAC